MIQIRALKQQAILTCTLMMVLGGQSAQAGTITGQQIIATFGGVVTAGSIANDPVAGQNTYLNNATSAIYNINNGVVSNNLVSSNMNWGSYSEANPTGFLPDSVLVFVGNTIPSTHATTAFNLGSLTFLNGTSDLPTLIFGATMNFYAGSVSSGNFLGSDTIVITTTSNIFGVPGGLTNGDDDYINVCGPLSGICGTSIEAVESSEGGTGVVVNLTGTIVGDPMLNISSVALAPGQNPTTNGFLGTDPPVGAVVPEPATWGTTACVLLLGCLLFRRRLLTAGA
jgi:hypothetical protein